jgi:hypothetical protein
VNWKEIKSQPNSRAFESEHEGKRIGLTVDWGSAEMRSLANAVGGKPNAQIANLWGISTEDAVHIREWACDGKNATEIQAEAERFLSSTAQS